MPRPVSKGGIHLIERTQFEMEHSGVREWRVLNVGPGRRTKKGVLIPMEVNPGDRVLTHSYTEGPTPLKDGTSIINSEQVIAVLPGPAINNV